MEHFIFIHLLIWNPNYVFSAYKQRKCLGSSNGCLKALIKKIMGGMGGRWLYKKGPGRGYTIFGQASGKGSKNPIGDNCFYPPGPPPPSELNERPLHTLPFFLSFMLQGTSEQFI